MSTALYGKGRDKFLTGDIDWINDTISSLLVDTGTYTVDIDVDEWESDVSGVVSQEDLVGQSTALGVGDANDTVHSSVSGATVEAIVLFKDTGTPGSSALIAYIDNATGLPVTPNGGDITIQWDSGANKIFKL